MDRQKADHWLGRFGLTVQAPHRAHEERNRRNYGGKDRRYFVNGWFPLAYRVAMNGGKFNNDWLYPLLDWGRDYNDAVIRGGFAWPHYGNRK